MTFCVMPYIEYASAAPATDPYAANVVSLMRFEGGSIVDDIGDNIWTLTGATLSSTTPVTGSGSLLTTAQTQYAKTTTNPTRFQFGTGDFTVEWSAALGTQTAGYPVPMEFVNDDGAYNYADTTWQFYFTPGTPVLSWWKDSTIDVGNNVPNAFDGNVHRYAVSRVSGVLYMYYDGVQIATATDGTNYTGGNTLIIGNGGDFNGGAIGKYDEVRITKGVGRYSGASYTVSTDPFPSTEWVPPVANTGWLYPTAASQTASGGSISNWSNLGNLFADDGNCASSSSTSYNYTQNLRSTDFAASVPTGKVIVGIEYEIKAYLSAGSGSANSFALHSNGVRRGTAAYPAFTASPTTYTFGGPTNTLGFAFTPAIVNASTFGVLLECYSGSAGATYQVDYMKMKIYYS